MKNRRVESTPKNLFFLEDTKTPSPTKNILHIFNTLRIFVFWYPDGIFAISNF